MTVETMEIVIKYVIILHNMCVEERTADDPFEDMKGESDVVVGGGINPMWCGLVHLTGQRVIPPGTGSIAASCETTRYIENEGLEDESTSSPAHVGEVMQNCHI